MPQDLMVALPWPLRSNPRVPRARERSLLWLEEYGLLDARGFTADEFTDWRLAELAGFFFPEADEEGLQLASDLMGWYFAPFDDQFDGPLGHDPRRAATICDGLLAALARPAPARPASWSPGARALADLWRRSRLGTSPAWQARALLSWKGYLAAQVAESVDRHHGRTPDARDCLRRRQATSAHVVIDLIERTGGFEVPDLAWHHPVLTELRQLTSELIGLTNDLCSLEKEEACGDRANNVVLVLEDERSLSRAEAIAEVTRLAQRRVTRFLDVQDRAADLHCVLSPSGRTAVERFLRGLQTLVRGDSEWERSSGRYAPHHVAAAAQRAADLPTSRWRPLDG
ncbi:terpene synthase family protein [Streptomyces sp. G45]|uniref:terpene synthase family protein n=1 Tax=Streptomyces sp. G45 TaxID=3406627 RepID=UPI003C1A26FC